MKPKHLDYWARNEIFEGRTLVGVSTVRVQAIYSIDGTTLTVCYGTSHKKRPVEFVSNEESDWLYILEKSEKP